MNEGRSTGVRDEPDWDRFPELGAPPLPPGQVGGLYKKKSEISDYIQLQMEERLAERERREADMKEERERRKHEKEIEDVRRDDERRRSDLLQTALLGMFGAIAKKDTITPATSDAKKLSDMNVQEVINNIIPNCEECMAKFRQHNIDGEVISQVNDELLQEIGINHVICKARIKSRVAKHV